MNRQKLPEQTILIVDDDQNIGWALATGLEEPGRDVIVCRDVESAELILEKCPVTHVLTDIKFSGPFGFEGLQVIDRVRERVSTAPVIAITGHATDELRREARARGAAALLQKPFSFDEIDDLIPPVESGDKGTVTFIPTMDQIISDGLLTSVFQPIVWIDHSRHAVGFEALSRLQADSPLADPESLFRYAVAKQRVADLELAALESAIQKGKELSRVGFLSVNVHPELFSFPDRFCDALFASAETAEVPLPRLVVEITEQGPLPPLQSVEAVCTVLHAQGVRIGFDDIGIAHSHLSAMAAARPSFLKISQHFGTSCENNPVNRKIVENLESLARSFSCEVVLEGIETGETAAFARETGIRFGQGYFFSRPLDSAALMRKYS